jgi:hypothetical protein
VATDTLSFVDQTIVEGQVCSHGFSIHISMCMPMCVIVRSQSCGS